MTGPASQRDDYHAKLMPVELLIAHNPDPESRLAYLLRLRDAVFWQSPRTRKQARPDVRTPTARAAGIAELVAARPGVQPHRWHFALCAGSTRGTTSGRGRR